MKFLLVGGNGYLGSRLREMLPSSETQVIDLNIYKNCKGGKRLEDLTYEHYKNAVVVWLASFHREPDNLKDISQWAGAYDAVMRLFPSHAARYCKRLIYLSSMRAISDSNSLYGSIKRNAEEVLLSQHDNISVLRFGTVWGGARPGKPFRPNTAINYSITREKFTGNHWSAHITHIDKALDSIHAHVTSAYRGDDRFVNTVSNILDLPRKINADEVRALLNGTFGGELQRLYNNERRIYVRIEDQLDIEQEARATKALWRAYDLKLLDKNPEYNPDTGKHTDIREGGSGLLG